MIRILFLFLLLIPNIAFSKVFTWQTIAKHVKKHTLLQKYPTTLYSGCLITKDWLVDFESCNFYFRYVVRNTIDLEHIVTAERMRKHTGCGKLSRTKCRKSNAKFKMCHNSRDNIYPSISTVNRSRGNLPFAELINKNTFFPFGEEMGFRKSIAGDAVEPPERNKRLIGKTYLLMEMKGCIKLSDTEKLTFSIWALD